MSVVLFTYAVIEFMMAVVLTSKFVKYAPAQDWFICSLCKSASGSFRIFQKEEQLLAHKQEVHFPRKKKHDKSKVNKKKDLIVIEDEEPEINNNNHSDKIVDDSKRYRIVVPTHIS